MEKSYELPFLDSCTEEEKELMEELKERVFSELTPRLLQDESLCYRFLKARDFNIKNAEAMLRKHFSVRKIYDIENSLSYVPPEYLSTHMPYCYLGCDKEGMVITYTDGGGDLKGVSCLYSVKEMLQYMLSYVDLFMEEMTVRSKKCGKLITTHISIINMASSNILQLTSTKVLECILRFVRDYQDNYPERVKAVYVINASKQFYFLFKLIKPAMASALVEKIHIYGTTGWQDLFLEIFDVDVLPAFLGGNRTDPDGNPMCYSFLKHAKKVPEELFKIRETLDQETGFERIMVPRKSKTEVEVNVNTPNTNIEWKFQTKYYDIEFGVYYRDYSSSKLLEIIPLHRIDTDLAPNTGVYKSQETGTYVIVFDNSYSWLHPKEILYKIELIEPEVKKILPAGVGSLPNCTVVQN